MPTSTTNYSLYKPLVADAIDEDLWGGYLNDNFDTLDTTVKAVSDATYSLTSAKTGNYTVLAADRNKTILVDATAGNLTMTLLAAATAANGFEISFKKTDATVNTVIIDGNASETLDGSATYTITEENECVTFVCDGSNWKLKSNTAQAPTFIITTTSTSAFDSGTGVIPNDDTIPQNTEGNEFITLAYTPTSATNRLQIRAFMYVSTSLQDSSTMALFQDTTADALAATKTTSGYGGAPNTIALEHDMVAGTTSSTTFKIRCGATAGTTYLNSDANSGARKLGGVASSRLTIMEYTP